MNYKIYRRVDGTIGWGAEIFTTASAAIFSYKDQSISAGARYDYSVSCSNTAFGESDLSDALSSVIAVSLPSSNKKPSLIKATKNNLFIQWSASENGGDVSNSLLYSLEMRDVSEGGSLALFR